MKNILSLAKVVILALLFTISSCSSNDDGGGGTPGGTPGEGINAQIVELTSIMGAGPWTVSFYFDVDHEETSNFNTFAFNFDPQRVLEATDTVIVTYTGTWVVAGDDTVVTELDFDIMFTSPPDYEELSDDWQVLSYTPTKLELKGSNGTSKLTFERL